MADFTIRVDPLNPLSVLRAEMLYKKRLREFDEKVDIFLERLAEYGREVAALGFGEAVDVTAEPIDGGYAIIASGQAVGFLEFGAGDTVASDDPFAEQVSYEVRPGSWSEAHYDAATDEPRPSYHLDGKWVFGGVTYTQITPRKAMFTAWQSVQENWRAIAEEVFA